MPYSKDPPIWKNNVTINKHPGMNQKKKGDDKEKRTNLNIFGLSDKFNRSKGSIPRHTNNE